MSDFTKDPRFERLFHSNEDFSILCVGYNDFHVVRPAPFFRRQSFYTLHFILSGKGVLEAGGKRYELSAGDMFFLPPDLTMRYFPSPDDPWDYVWFALKGDASARYGQAMGFGQDCFAKHNESALMTEGVLRRLFSKITEPDCEYFSVLSYFYKLLAVCCAPKKQTGAREIREIVDENFTSPSFTVEKLCTDTGISHAQLLRIFKASYGETVIGYVLKKRMALACELLASTDLPVSTIGYSCGFSDEIHFMKSFKRAVGLSALAYRKAGKK